MGAGKSRIICEKVWHLALRYPGATFGIFRKTQASLSATTERTFWRDVADPSRVTARNKSEHWVEVQGGARIYFLGLDPDPITGVPSKVGSLDLACAYVDEAVELSEPDWIMLRGRLRDPRMTWHQLGAATNPASPQHWLKRLFTPPTEERVYLQASGNDLLPADYLKMLAGLPNTAHGKRLGQGLWVAAEGAIYELPPDQIVALDLTKLSWKRVVAGIDWGFVHAFACEVVGQTGSGRLAVLREVYRTGTLIDDLIPELRLLQTRYRIDTFYADPSEPEYIAACQKAGLPVTPATNDVLPGIEAVATAIKAGMTVDPSCTGLLDELPNYSWAPDRASGNLKEQPVKIGDDACDSLRYALMGLTVGGVLLHT
jgi:phage terminase large subunit